MSSAVIGPMRPRFLILTPACIALGIATAYTSGASLRLLDIVLILIGATSAHASVNALNEYFDFKSGLDLITEATPFSGGTKTLPGIPEKARMTLWTGLITLGLTGLIGAYFLVQRGLGLLPLGVAGLVLVYIYTTWITKSPFWCLISPGLGFGPLMVMGTDFVLTGSYSWAAFVASLVPFFLVNDLLLLNQFPDVEADKQVGRYHLPIAAGRPKSASVYNMFLAAAYLPPIIGVITGLFAPTSLIALLTLGLALPVMRGVKRYADDVPQLIPYMIKNVLINIITPILLAVGILGGRLL